ncbi:MAG: DUF547 domain-containing protein [Phycisphaerales bacterium]|nr:DUF547 domain-containing protein [Phycisphaerales bacterium]
MSDPPSERAPMTLPDTDRWTTEAEVPWSFTYKPYEEVLRKFVDDKGLVDYAGLLTDRQALDRFLVGVSRLEMSTYRLWSMREQEAFWINLYNALLLKVATDFYPIAPEPFDPEYPRDSIRQLGDVFTKSSIEVLGGTMTPDNIEKKVLRDSFDDPRVHVALVCAAKGCPPLRQEPYLGDKIDKQLKDQLDRMVNDPRYFLLQKEEHRVYLSELFKWYGDEYVELYNTSEAPKRRNESESAALNYIGTALSPEDQIYLRKEKYGVLYIPYDWSLNDQASSSTSTKSNLDPRP